MLQSLPSTIIPLLLGRAADKFGKKQMIVGGLVLYIVGGLMMVVAKTVGLYTAGLLINAVGIATGYGSNGPAIADNFPDKAGRYISWIEASGCVAQTLVPLIAVAIGVTWRPMYLMVSVLAVIPMLLICFVRIPKYSSADPANTGSNSRAKITISLIILSFAMLFYCGMDATYASFVDAFFVDQRNIATHGSIALTLHGALYAVSRFLTGLIKKGDIVIIKIDGEPLLIKRLIATEGDTVSVSDGKLFLNGEALTEPYLGEAIAYEMEEIVIPEGHCFILGDNRNFSHDSHIFGPVPVSAVYASKKSK